MHRYFNQLGRIGAIIAVGSVSLIAQGTQTCTITGEVLESNGAGIAGVTVRLTSPSLQGARVLASDEKGRFIARLLPPGVYTIELTKSGYNAFKTTEKVGIDQNYQPRFTMAKTVGAVVEVVATNTAVDKTDVKTASNYSLDNVDQLPTTNRTMETVALLTPGVVAGVGGRVQIRGAMTSGNLYLVDGQNVADNAYGNRGVRMIDDAVEEMQVITGAISAEYGSVDGGVINTVTRSGGNTFTGQWREELSNPQWNAVQPMQNRTAIANQLSEQKTFSLGGYILKDRLWFSGSYFRQSVNQSSSLGSGALGTIAGNGNYNYNREEIRRQLKLTWLINQNHTLVYAWQNSQNAENLRDYSAGELNALVPQTYKDSLYNVALRSVWTSNLTTDLRFGQKKQTYGAGPAVDGSQIANSPISDDGTGYYYGHGVFNANDGGDHRDNHTINAKVSLFWDAAGSHATDFGADYYEGIRRARNEQTTTGYILEVDKLQYKDWTGIPVAMWVYESGAGEAKTKTTGVYLNDKWTVSNKLSFQIGLRYDKYKAESDTGITTVSANGFSPRLGLKWDVLGDAQWVLGASWARYNSAVAEGITTQVTRQGNPKEIDYYWSGDPNAQVSLAPGTPVWNLANYPQTAANVAYYGNPSLNVKLSDSLKAPHVDETQLSAAYSFKNDLFGTGAVKLTYVNKEWHDLLDYQQGNQGTVTDPAADFTAYMKVWGNSNVAKRKYHDLELDAQAQKGTWSFSGNITWARTEGNYEGEGSSTPARGEGLQAWTTTYVASSRAAATLGQPRTVTFSPDITSPYGALTGNVPLRMRLTGSYYHDSAYGRTTWGLIYRFDSGSHYSLTRNITPSQIDVDLGGLGAGTNFTQYYGGQRGQFVLPASSYTDLSITQDWQLAKVKGTPVKAFVKLVITNVWNHQQILGWNTTINSASGVATNSSTYTGANGAVASVWKPGSNFGKQTGSANFGAARSFFVSAGVRF